MANSEYPVILPRGRSRNAKSARQPVIRRAMSAAQRASPQRSLWLPSTHRSPGLLTAAASHHWGRSCPEDPRRAVRDGLNMIHFDRLEAENGDVEPFRAQQVCELRYFDRQALAIPSRVLCDLVVGDRKGPPFRRRKSGDDDAGTLSRPSCIAAT